MPDPLAALALRRLRSQRLTGPPLANPAAVVHHLVAVQAQDYPAAKWGVAQRTRAATDAEVDRALDEGRILRTHVLRPTWHLVAPSDIHLLLELTAPRVRALMSHYDRRLGLDARTYKRSNDAIVRALEKGRHLTRIELRAELASRKIIASGQKLAHVLIGAELDAVVCSGVVRGKQQTYALLSERVPSIRKLPRAEALAELALRYLRGHGPALPQDLAWWSGLTVADAKAGIAAARSKLASEEAGGRSYAFIPGPRPPAPRTPVIHLLPNYDEHLIAYRDHAVSVDPGFREKYPYRTAVLGGHVVTRNGRAIGGWRRTIGKGGVRVATQIAVPLSAGERRALEAAVERHARFLGLPLLP